MLVLETREVDPVSLVRFEHVLLTKGAVAQFEEMLGMNASRQPHDATPDVSTTASA